MYKELRIVNEKCPFCGGAQKMAKVKATFGVVFDHYQGAQKAAEKEATFAASPEDQYA